jgi:hypothetical protein
MPKSLAWKRLWMSKTCNVSGYSARVSHILEDEEAKSRWKGLRWSGTLTGIRQESRYCVVSGDI